MGNFEKLSVLVIVVIIVMILVVALYTWTDNPEAASGTQTAAESAGAQQQPPAPPGVNVQPTVFAKPAPAPAPPAPTPPSAPPVRPDAVPAPLPLSQTPELGTQDPKPPTTVEPAKPEPKTHVVQPGETMERIARVYYPGSVAKATAAIQAANPAVDPSRMKVGQKLLVPPLEGATMVAAEGAAKPAPAAGRIERGGTYTVRRGDTLAKIASAAYGNIDRWPEIWMENYEVLGEKPEIPEPGTRLRIPR